MNSKKYINGKLTEIRKIYQIWKDNRLIKEIDTLKVSEENDFRAIQVFEDIVYNNIWNDIVCNCKHTYTLEVEDFYYDEDKDEYIELYRELPIRKIEIKNNIE